MKILAPTNSHTEIKQLIKAGACELYWVYFLENELQIIIKNEVKK